MNLVKKILSKAYAKIYILGKQHYEEEMKKCFYKKGVIDKSTVFSSGADIQNSSNILENIVIGKQTQIAGLIMIYPYGGKVTIGDYCSLSPNSRIISGLEVRIGDRVLIGHNVNIIDNNSHPLNAEERHIDFVDSYYNGKMEKYDLNMKPIIIDDDVWIGYNSSIMKGVTIGKGAVIGANSVVTKNVEPFTINVGNPLRVIKKI